MAVSCGRASAKRGLSNMKSVVSIRHLLAGSSFVALLAASNAALGASIVNLGSTSHLQVTTPVDTVVNLGTVANSAGLPGIGVSGETVSGPIINDGTIDIDGDLSAVGILVEGTSGVGAAAVGAGIINDDDGQITVRADNTSGDAMAGGIVVVGSAVSLGGDILNYGAIDVRATAFDGASGSATANVSGRAAAAGILLSITGTDYGIRNEGSITVGASDYVGVSAVDHGVSASAQATGDAFAGAIGLGVGMGDLFHGGSGVSVAYVGSLVNSGDITVSAFAGSDNRAEAVSSSATTTGTYADASGSANAYAAGIGANVAELGSSFENSGNIGVEARAQSFNVAIASAPSSSVQATADANVDAGAYGIDIHAGSIAGGVFNSGAIDVSASSLAQNTATAQAGGGNAYAYVDAEASATATGIRVDTGYLDGSFVNAGIMPTFASSSELAPGSINARAIVQLENHAAASGTSLANIPVADASASGSASAEARGISFYANAISGDFINEGAISAYALAGMNNHAIAAGVDASAEVSGSLEADATGIDAYFGVLGGSFENSGDVNAVALVYARGVAEATGVSDATADVSMSSASANATGIYVSGGSLGGSFINSGDVMAIAGAVVVNSAFALAESGSARAETSIDDEVSAYATGIYVGINMIAGDFENSGNVIAGAGAVAFGVAEATGGSYAKAEASSSDITAEALGIGFYSDSMGGDFTNSGDVMAIAAAAAVNGEIDLGSLMGGLGDLLGGTGSALVMASSSLPGFGLPAGGALASADSAYANAYGSAQATATGIDLSFYTLGGRITNSGDITAIAVAAVVNDAQATGGSYAEVRAESDYADAEAYGVMVDGWSIGGGIVNSGEVDAAAFAVASNVAQARADGADAGAKASGVYATAIGFGIDVSTLNGGFENQSGAVIDAEARAVSYNAAQATGVSNAYAAAGAENQYVQASGVRAGYNHSLVFNGDFVNAGGISAAAYGLIENQATAMAAGGEATAASYIDGFGVSATGVYASFVTVGGDFINEGTVTADATAIGRSRATANGASAAAGDELAVRALAEGIDFSAGLMFGDFINDGDVTARAVASLDSHNIATATSGTAQAGGGVGSFMMSTQAVAEAYGVVAGFGSALLGSFENNGQVTAEALANVVYAASAAGTSMAYAEADASGAARAQGVGVFGNHIDGWIGNSGGIDALASALISALAAGATSVATAHGRATATGLAIDVDSIYGGIYNGDTGLTFTLVETPPSNSGVINATALVEATAQGGSDMSAGAYARAFGVKAEVSSTLGGGFWNSGSIAANASANARIIGDDAAEGDAMAVAYATGVSLAAGAIGWDVLNEGTISAFAHAHVEIPGENAYGGGYADARGLVVEAGYGGIDGSVVNAESATIHARALVDGNPNEMVAKTAIATALYVENAGSGYRVANSGLIHAEATDPTRAEAHGLVVSGGNYYGELYNSGTIEANARFTVETGASEDMWASATAIRLTDGASFAGGIVNTGNIIATADGLSGLTATAINIEDEGAAHTIAQLDGSIVGDIRMANSYGDTIDWSGGTIEGDLYADSLDTLNVFNGSTEELLPRSFTFAGDISNLGTLNVNTPSYSGAAAGLTLGGTVGAVDLNVRDNGTLTVAPTAEINVTNYTQESGGTLVFQLKPTAPQHGVINADSVTLDEGAQSEAVLAPGLFAATNSFTVINSNSFTGTFDFSYSGTTLYNVSDEYLADGAGYVIHVDRISFAEIPGLNGNGSNLGQAIDNALGNVDPDSDLAKKLSQVLTSSPEEYADALNQLAGSQDGDLMNAGMSQPTRLLQIVFGELSGFGGFGIADLGTLVKVADNQVTTTMNDAGPGYSVTTGTAVARPISVWARVFGSWASLDRSTNSAGFTSDGGGVVVGGDYQFTENFAAGLAAGYQRDRVDFRGTGKSDIDSWSISAYAKYEMDKAYVNGLLGYSWQDYDTDRRFAVLGTNYNAHHSTDGGTFSAGAEAGYNYDIGDKAKLVPYVSFFYGHTTIDGATETGASPFNLVLSDRSANSAQSKLGVRWTKTFASSGGTEWTPTLDLGWKHEFGDSNPSTTAAISGLAGSSFSMIGADTARDAAVVGAGINLKFSDQIDGTVQYNGEYSSDYTDNVASLKLRLRF